MGRRTGRRGVLLGLSLVALVTIYMGRRRGGRCRVSLEVRFRHRLGTLDLDVAFERTRSGRFCLGLREVGRVRFCGRSRGWCDRMRGGL